MPESDLTMIFYEFFSQTDPGLLRDNNEDAVTFDNDTRLAVLADGMGGYNAGEIAANMATTFIKTELIRWLSEVGKRAGAKEVKRAMEICVDNANRAIYNSANSNAQYAGMGTTLVMAIFQDTRVIVGHVGDSRCYLFRAGELYQITRDHSLLQEQLDAGLITPEEAAVSLNKNLVTRALGVEDTVLLEAHEHALEPEDVYLLCSDGLTDMVSDEQIAQILATDDPLETRAKRLVDTANANGGRDNITVLLTHAHASSKKRGFMSRLLGK
jgi:serine/threonine protein phosphatase PrpC